jgi:hypothetical protein
MRDTFVVSIVRDSFNKQKRELVMSPLAPETAKLASILCTSCLATGGSPSGRQARVADS